MSAKPVDLKLDSYNEVEDGGHTVTTISILGAPVFPAKFNVPTRQQLVHWRVHLRWATDDGTLADGSVVLDTYKEEGDLADCIVTIEVASRPILVSETAGNHWEFHVPVTQEGLTVQTIINLLIANGRHGYKYDGKGSGCLSWSTTLLSDYVAAGYVDAGATKRLKDFIEAFRRDETKYWVSDDRGTFIL